MQIQIELEAEQISTITRSGAMIGYSPEAAIKEFEKSITEHANSEVLNLFEILEDWSK